MLLVVEFGLGSHGATRVEEEELATSSSAIRERPTTTMRGSIEKIPLAWGAVAAQSILRQTLGTEREKHEALHWYKGIH